MTLLRVARRVFDRGFLVTAVASCAVEVGFRLISLPRLTRLLGIRLPGVGPGYDGVPHLATPDPALWLHRRLVAVDRVHRNWPFGDTCLRRALVLGWRIRRLEPVLVIGVRVDEHGAVLAHAWLTVGGTSLDPSHVEYAPLVGQPRRI